MGTKVATSVTATPGTTPLTGADSGTWTAAPLQCESYPKLKSGGQPVVYRAACTFTFTGSNSATGATITGSSPVTLAAGATKLQKGASKVLVDGDEVEDSYGNKLTAVAGGKLQSG